MKTLLSIFVVTVFVAVAYGATTRRDIAQSTGQCHSDGVGTMEKGEIKTVPGQCVKVRCFSAGTLMYTNCYDPKPGCTQSAPDLTKQYPECCPKDVCS